jgi:hypothetical protein
MYFQENDRQLTAAISTGRRNTRLKTALLGFRDRRPGILAYEFVHSFAINSA